jgi:hypothetical protein
MAELPIHVHTIPPPAVFPEFQRRLRELGGTTPDGRPRLILEWGGEAVRPHGFDAAGNPVYVAKYPLMGSMAKKRYGWRFAFRYEKPDEAMILGLPTYADIDQEDLGAAEAELKAPPGATVGIPVSLECYVDFPQPNFYLCDWLSPQKMLKGGWRREFGPEPTAGYYQPIIRIHNPRNVGMLGFRGPDEADLDMARRYQHEKDHDTLDMGRHYDDPIDGGDLQTLNGWVKRALASYQEEQHAGRVEEVYQGLKEAIAEQKRGASIVVPA